MLIKLYRQFINEFVSAPINEFVSALINEFVSAPNNKFLIINSSSKTSNSIYLAVCPTCL